jgi:hypothetical protein
VTASGASRLAYFYNNSGRDLRLLLQPDFRFTRILGRRDETQLPGTRFELAARETAILEFR